MFDVFYTGPKPDLFVFEKFAVDLEDAAAKSKTEFFWFIDGANDYSKFDFNWQPAPWDNSYVHVFADQWHECGNVFFAAKNIKQPIEYKFQKSQSVKRKLIESSADIFYVGAKPNLFENEFFAANLESAAKLCTKEYFWFLDGNNDYSNFDFSWFPTLWDRDYTHVFPSQWHANGGVYFAKKITADRTRIKFQHCQAVKRKVNLDNWIVPDNIDSTNFDFSWHPNPLEPDYEYHFPTQWQSAGGPVFKGTSGTKLVAVQHATALPTLDNWIIPNNIDSTKFDFSWHPSPLEVDYEYHFPTQWQADGGPVYKGTAGVKLVAAQQAVALPDPDRWIIPEGVDISEFDLSWHPSRLEPDYEYHFPTQWQRDGGPVYKGTAGIKYVAAQKAYTTATQIFYMDFMNPGSKEQFEKLKAAYPGIKSTRYVDSHLNVLRRIVNLAESRFVWVISSICDYSTFDFTWHPEPWQQEMIHVFPSGHQKRGDTFYINVDSFKTQQYDLEILDWFNVINYCSDQRVHRIMPPTVNYDTDNLVEVIKNYDFKFPYAVFTNLKWAEGVVVGNDICLWSEKDRVVESYTNSNATCTIPRDIKIHLQTQVYDYPHISKNTGENKYLEEFLDVVYISNGEPDAERWYSHLEHLVGAADANRLHRVTNVNGRMAAYRAAAEKSTTPWFFAVFAKLEVDPKFNFTWQPDYFQEPKHYIFNARNPVNGLEYGHMGMIAYNKKLVLETAESGLDFTLSKAHEVVPILSGIAHYNQDAWTTWRTAFREVVKLKHFSVTQPSVETNFRLKKWLTVGNGEFGEWSIRGAADAVEYYEAVNGDFSKLMLTYEWAWLQKYYSAKY